MDASSPSSVGGDPLVSAIMPLRNAADTVTQAIRAIQTQSYRNWELIVVDDGSTDESAAIVRQLARDDTRITLIEITHGGRGVARNHCLAHVRGEFVAICDADDVSLPSRFTTQVEMLQRSGADVCSCSEVIAFNTARTTTFVVSAPSSDAQIHATFSSGRMPLLFASAMLRADLFTTYGGFDPELQRNQDFGFLVRHHRLLSFVTTSTPLLLYRVQGLTAPWAQVRENNFYRWLALRRSNGAGESAAELALSWTGMLYRAVVIPAQFSWFVLRRRLFRDGIRALTAIEREQLETALATPTVAAMVNPRR